MAGGEREQWCFQSLPPLPTIKLGPSSTDSQVGGLVHALCPCGSLQRTVLWGWEFLLLPPHPPQVFSISGLKLYFPTLEPWVAQSALLPRCSSWFIYVRMWATGSASCHLAMSPLHPSYQYGWMFLLISFVVGLPYSSIFCQFWLFFVFKLLLSFFWLWKRARCVYLHLHLGGKPWFFIFLMYLFTTVNFPLDSFFIVSHIFLYVEFSFLYVSWHFLISLIISPLIHQLINNILLNFYIFVNLQIYFYYWFLALLHWDWKWFPMFRWFPLY